MNQQGSALPEWLRYAVTGSAAWSRTITAGRVDSAAAPANKEEGLSADAGTVDAFTTSFVEAGLFLDALAIVEFSPALLMELNSRLVRPAYERSFLRDFNVPKYGYLEHSLVREDLEQFCDRVRARNQATPVGSAVFDVHWSVNLHGHYFRDGCGRTALLVGTWVGWRLGGILWALPDRADYLNLVRSRDPAAEWLDLTAPH